MKSPTPRLVAGLVFTLLVIGAYAANTLHSVTRMREVQTDIVDRNRRGSLQLIRIQNDLNALAVDTSTLPFQNPLPETAALISFPFYQIHNLNPVGYLGYLYFLEFLPTGSGGEAMAAFERAGVPRHAMGFLHDHATIDVGHNQLMEGYIKALITTERELSSVIYAMRVTGTLYARMIEAAFADADNPVHWGLSAEECRAEQSDPFGSREEKSGAYPRVRFPLDEAKPAARARGRVA